MSVSEVHWVRTQKRLLVGLTLVGLCLLICLMWLVAWLAWDIGGLLTELSRMGEQGLLWLNDVHWSVLLAALALLPLLGCPVSPLLVVAGISCGVWGGILVSAIGMSLNNLFGYLVASSWLRGPVERRIRRWGWRLPEVEDEEVWQVIVVLRLTPGIPLWVQTYLLGLARVPLLRYLVVSLAVQILSIVAFVMTGGSLYKGSTGLILMGVCLVIVLGLGGKVLLNQVKKRRRATSSVALTSSGE